MLKCMKNKSNFYHKNKFRFRNYRYLRRKKSKEYFKNIAKHEFTYFQMEIITKIKKYSFISWIAYV